MTPNPRPAWRNPWSWVPSLYVAEGLPYVLVMTVAVILYKGLGISNTDIALYTSWLYLPWVLKPFWSPVVDILRTRRLWIWVMQLLVGGDVMCRRREGHDPEQEQRPLEEGGTPDRKRHERQPE